VTVAALNPKDALPQGQVQGAERAAQSNCGVDFAGVVEHPSFNLYERRDNNLW
jgi:hypothetical protein